jgi:hypothetical protein
MLRANVGVSRKISREYQSTGYSVSLDGEIPFGPDDAEGVLDKVAELFHLAEEALRVQIERDHGNPPAGPRRETPSPPTTPAPAGGHPTSGSRAAPPPNNRPPTGNDRRPTNAPSPAPEPATPKQLQYLQTLGKRKGLSRDELDAVIARVVGAAREAGELTKREAGAVIDHLTQLEPEAAQ